MFPGLLRVDGLMPGRSKMFDTPGVVHPHQLSGLLSPAEVSLTLYKGPIYTLRSGPLFLGSGIGVLGMT